MAEIILLAAACTAAGMAGGFAIGLKFCSRRRRREKPTSTADSFLRLLKH